jgi:uncharacterized membrane protein
MAALLARLFLVQVLTPAMQYPQIIETLGAAIDVAGVLLIIIGLLIATGRYLVVFRSLADGYTRYRQDIGRAILLGLEVLVAADIIRTVAVTPTLVSVAVLAGIVLIRTFLSFSLEVELNGRFPWQKPRSEVGSRSVRLALPVRKRSAGERECS